MVQIFGWLFASSSYVFFATESVDVLKENEKLFGWWIWTKLDWYSKQKFNKVSFLVPSMHIKSETKIFFWFISVLSMIKDLPWF